MKGEMLYSVGGDQFILGPFSHFKMQDFKHSKKNLPEATSFPIFLFSDLRQVQGFR